MVTVGKKKINKKFKLLFRCDAGSYADIGTGHVVRTLRLAERLVFKKIVSPEQITIMYRHENGFNLAKNLVANSQYNFNKLSFIKKNYKNEFALIIKHKPDLIIFDILKTNKTLLSKLKKKNKLLIGFDELGNGLDFFDYLFFSLVEPKYKKASYKKEFKYLNLSTNLIKKTYIRKKISNIVISLGGNDKRNLANLICKLVPCLNNKITFHFFLGKNDYKKFKKNKNYSLKKNIKAYDNPKDYYLLASKADLGIVAGGITLFEFVAMGIPTIAIPQHDHQLKNIESLEKENVTLSLKRGMKIDKDGLKRSITYLDENLKLRRNMNIRGKLIFDGKGLNRIVKTFRSLLSN